MSDQTHLMYIRHSRSVVANMSATIFAGIIQSTPLHASNEDDLIAKSVSIAIKLAEVVDTQLESDDQ